MATLFNLTTTVTSTVGLETWVDLGLIPSGYDYWIGTGAYTAITKAMTFELRTNIATKATGTTTNTTLLDTAAPKVGATISHDLYKKGTLHTKTVKSTGVEHWWLRIFSKTTTSGSYSYKIAYTLE